MSDTVLFRPIEALELSDGVTLDNKKSDNFFPFELLTSRLALQGSATLFPEVDVCMIQIVLLLTKERFSCAVSIMNAHNAASYLGYFYANETRRYLVWQHSIQYAGLSGVSQEVMDQTIASAGEMYEAMIDAIDEHMNLLGPADWWANTDGLRPA